MNEFWVILIIFLMGFFILIICKIWNLRVRRVEVKEVLVREFGRVKIKYYGEVLGRSV